MLRVSNSFALTCACVRMWSICRYNVGVNNRNKNANKVGKWYERIRYLFIHSGIRIPPLPSTSRNPNPITLKCSMPEPDIIVPPLSVEKESFFFGRRARRSATRFTKKKIHLSVTLFRLGLLNTRLCACSSYQLSIRVERVPLVIFISVYVSSPFSLNRYSIYIVYCIFIYF